MNNLDYALCKLCSWKLQWLLNDLWPHICWVTCVFIPKNHCFQVPLKSLKVCVRSDQLCAELSFWDQWPHMTFDHIWWHTFWGHTVFFFHIGIFTSESYWHPSKCAQMISFWTSWYNDLKWPLTPLIMWPCGPTRWSLHPSPICGAVFRDQVQPGPDFPLLWKVWAGLLLQPD